MSLPKFPEIPDDYNVDTSIIQILTSIAMEEIGLSHILNAEGEKLQYILGTLHKGKSPDVTIDEVIEINESVKEMLKQVAFNQMFLSTKMSDALTAYFSVDKTVPKPKPDKVKVDINGDYAEIILGNGYIVAHTIEPEQYNDQGVWESSDPSVASVDGKGIITTHKLGTTVIKLSVGDAYDSIVIRVIEDDHGTDETLPLIDGKGPYESRVDNDDVDNSFQLIVAITIPYQGAEPKYRVVQDGSIKLKDILKGDVDLDGINVRPVDPAFDGYFTIGTDKAGDSAIIFTYIAPLDDWREAFPQAPKVNNVGLILSKDGYLDTGIEVNLRYDGSGFIEVDLPEERR